MLCSSLTVAQFSHYSSPHPLLTDSKYIAERYSDRKCVMIVVTPVNVVTDAVTDTFSMEILSIVGTKDVKYCWCCLRLRFCTQSVCI